MFTTTVARIARRALPLESLLLALLVAWSAPHALSAQQDALTPWDVANLEYVGAAEISPDGGHVAYVRVVPRTPWEDEDGPPRTELHVLDWESGTTKPYVTAESGVRGVSWTADGTGIGFLAERGEDEHRALYVIPLEGGETRRAFGFDDRGVGEYEFSPDGSRMAVLAKEPESEEREKEEEKGFEQEIYEEDWRPTQVWIAVPFDEEAEPRLLEIEGHVSEVAWSPDGGRLAVAVAPTALVDDSYMEQTVKIVDVEQGEVVGTIENEGKLGPFTWSPDGSELALVAGIDVNDGSAARLLWEEAPADGGTVSPQPMLGERERDEHNVVWLDDGRLVVRGSKGVWSTLDAYRVQDGSAVERTELLPLEGPVWRSTSLSENGARAALVGSTPRHPDELFTLDVASGELRRRTRSNPVLEEVELAPQEVVRYEARDGLTIEGILIRPLSGETPAPLVVCVHGGPEAHLSNGWLTRYAYPGQVGAGEGYAVFYPNYRGSTGRGLAYLKESQGDPAGKEFDDVVDGVDHLIETGVADPERVGVTGGSYGGYATAWMSTYYSERFAAGVMFVGISNKISKVGTTDIPDEEYYVHALKRPWEDWQFFLERSPIYHAGDAETPLLILHGKEDPRVDPGQSREMYRHLKLRSDVPVRLVHYPGEGHGNRRAAARFDYNLRMLRWFDHYLRGEGGEAPDWPLDYQAHMPGEEESPQGT